MSESVSPDTSPPPPPRRRLRRWAKRLTMAVVILFLAAELILRIFFGLGNPPLMMFDPDMEYRFQPSKTYHRFGRLIHYNAYSQRAEDFPEHKSSPDELRVMVIGDSVINGGSQTDQSEVITSILQQKLRESLHRNVIVGNASAASWGPPNELAYVRKFGLFDADVVVLVFNDLDAYDVMTFEPIVGKSPEMPDHRPWLALQEVWSRYLPMFLARFRAPPPSVPSATEQEQIRSLAVCVDSVRKLIEIAREHGAKVILAQHRELPERVDPLSRPMLTEGHKQIAEVASEMGLTPVEWNDAFAKSMQSGHDPYRPADFVHPSVLGNQIIADALFPVIRDALQQAGQSSPRQNEPK